jgi:hypothetical protein
VHARLLLRGTPCLVAPDESILEYSEPHPAGSLAGEAAGRAQGCFRRVRRRVAATVLEPLQFAEGGPGGPCSAIGRVRRLTCATGCVLIGRRPLAGSAVHSGNLTQRRPGDGLRLWKHVRPGREPQTPVVRRWSRPGAVARRGLPGGLQLTHNPSRQLTALRAAATPALKRSERTRDAVRPPSRRCAQAARAHRSRRDLAGWSLEGPTSRVKDVWQVGGT